MNSPRPQRRLDLNLLPVFETIYREGNLSRAAEALSLTQPAVSHALARLREHTGDPLFVRRGRVMVPTTFAEQLIQSVRRGLGVLYSGLETAQTFDPMRLQRVFRLGLRDMLAAMVMPGLVGHCATHAPGVRFICVPVVRSNLRESLQAGRIDLATDAWMPNMSGIHRMALAGDRLVCLLREGHPALGEPWEVETLVNWPHVQVSSRQQGAGIEDLLLGRMGLRRRVVCRSPHFHASAEIVRRSDLLLCLPRRFAVQLLAAGGLAQRELPIEDNHIENFLYWADHQHEEAAHGWLRKQLLLALDVPMHSDAPEAGQICYDPARPAGTPHGPADQEPVT